MPNWCDNTLTVTGQKDELKKFRKIALFDGVFKMDRLHPTPTALLEVKAPNSYFGDDENEKKEHEKAVKKLVDKYGFTDWYYWRLSNWGTKWDVSEDSQNIINDDDNEISVSFSTAWSSPTEWVKKAAKKFPNLRFQLSYMEEGMGFCGVFTACGDDVLDEEGNIEYQDDDGNEVKYDDGDWYCVKSGKKIKDDDFYGIAVNPFE